MCKLSVQCFSAWPKRILPYKMVDFEKHRNSCSRIILVFSWHIWEKRRRKNRILILVKSYSPRCHHKNYNEKHNDVYYKELLLSWLGTHDDQICFLLVGFSVLYKQRNSNFFQSVTNHHHYCYIIVSYDFIIHLPWIFKYVFVANYNKFMYLATSKYEFSC